MDEIPKSIAEAADATSDRDVLAKLWEVVKLRIAEEDKRNANVVDRITKVIGYDFGVLGILAALIAFSSGLVKDAFRIREPWALYILLVDGLLYAGVAIFAFTVIRRALFVIKSQGYRTWNQDDLRYVTLNEREHREYSRFLIKAGWNLAEENKPVNDKKYEALDASIRKSLGLMGGTLGLIACFVLTGGLFAFSVERDEPNLRTKQENVMSNKDTTQIVKPATKPIPNPSVGELIKKGYTPTPLKPTPEPARGQKTTDGFDAK